MSRLEEIKEDYAYAESMVKYPDHDSGMWNRDATWLIEKLEKAIEVIKFYKSPNSFDELIEYCPGPEPSFCDAKVLEGYHYRAEEFLKELE